MIYIVLIFFGLAFGSFVNALVWRLHMQEKSEQRRVKSDKKAKKHSSLSTLHSSTHNKYSILKGRSMCPNCNHELGAKDLIPLISWLSLSGRCRYCQKPIHWQYPLVEVMTAFLFVQSYMFSNFEAQDTSYEILAFVFWLIFLVGLVALFVYDLKWMLLPDRIVFPLIYLVVALRVIESISLGSFSPIIEGSLGVLFLAGLFYLIFIISDGKWIGGGDVKLAIFMGILLGPLLSFLALFIASFLGSIIILGLMLIAKFDRKQLIPFGPFLIVATYIAFIWGQAVVDWYSSSFLTI